MEPKILISGNYNVFGEGFNCAGSYMCSGLYVSESFKIPAYIGGGENIQRRIEYEHLNYLEKNKHDNPAFQNSWNEHNLREGFVWFLLESCPSGQAMITEQKYLDLYRPFADEFGGFNISHNATAPMKGKNHSEESKKLMSKNSPKSWLGRKHTLESKILIKKKRKSQDMSYCKKSVKQIDKNTGETIKIWNSVREASIGLTGNKNEHSSISNVCNKYIRKNGSIRKTALGFKWEFV